MLEISDDGRGFATSRRSQAGMGIRIMHYRARVIGAGPAPGEPARFRDARVTCSVPCRPAWKRRETGSLETNPQPLEHVEIWLRCANTANRTRAGY